MREIFGKAQALQHKATAIWEHSVVHVGATVGKKPKNNIMYSQYKDVENSCLIWVMARHSHILSGNVMSRTSITLPGILAHSNTKIYQQRESTAHHQLPLTQIRLFEVVFSCQYSSETSEHQLDKLHLATQLPIT